MKSMGRYAVLATALAAALAASACTNTRSRGVDANGTPQQVVFPDIDRDKAVKTAITPNTDNLRKLVTGMNKKEISHLIGPPHFHEMLGARESTGGPTRNRNWAMRA